MATNPDDKVIKEIIKRYGASIDLKGSPYLIVEIIRQFGPKLGGGIVAECQPPGGTIPNPSDIIRELKARVADVNRLSAALEKAVKTPSTAHKAKAKTKARSTRKATASR